MTIPSPPAPPSVVLASASETRANLLARAGVVFTVEAARIDEDAIKAGARSEGASALDAATLLAEVKASRVARTNPGALVIGADQILVLGEEWFDKPDGMAAARDHLRRLSGAVHGLATAAVVVRDGRRLWHHASMPKLAMRPLSDAFIESYLADAGESVCNSVGAYQLEGLGAQLFARVDGDFFTVLGLPLLPLLAFLREHRVVPA